MWMVAGFSGEGATRRLSLDECASLLIETGKSDPIRLDLVEPQMFQRLTGREPPPPADPEEGYAGWLLP
jgi:hypothetical protein